MFNSTQLRLLLFLLMGSALNADFIHHSDIVRQVRKKFAEMETYKANFNIEVKEDRKTKTSHGTVYYKKGGKVNFTFKKPYGDQIISNGRKMWVYINKLNAVGVQSLRKNSKNLYQNTSYEGLVRLFTRYHYRFASAKQPREISGQKYYVFLLEEKVDSGGFHKIKLYVDFRTKLIRKMNAVTRSGREVKLRFSNISLNSELPGSLFTYKVEGNVKVVENPLTIN